MRIEPEPLEELPRILAGLDAPWWVAGGWAIDLALGRTTRAHEDLEIAVGFDDQEAVRRALRWWDLHVVASPGRLAPWRESESVALPRHQLWARRSTAAPWSLEVLFEVIDGDEWVFRRDDRIRLPLERFGSTAGGLPIVSPEVQLLYKAKELRPKDQDDFAVALPVLADVAAGWLDSTLALVEPAHPWRKAIRAKLGS